MYVKMMAGSFVNIYTVNKFKLSKNKCRENWANIFVTLINLL